jgi:hypothetical protein
MLPARVIGLLGVSVLFLILLNLHVPWDTAFLSIFLFDISNLCDFGICCTWEDNIKMDIQEFGWET